MAGGPAAHPGKAIGAEQAEIERGLFPGDKLSDDFANDRRELKAMTGAGAHNDNLRETRVPAEDKMFIRRIGI